MSMKICEMSKTKSISQWNDVLKDIEIRLMEARKRVTELENAKRVFKKMATDGAPCPGTEKSATQI
ncbi:MAG: hypothetical protein A3F68_11760 [Acidobacteria bacterium RIFCSPLOWO2_12_FULL_54_10]|nr:MAG: hypothetical protein A3F68_11760 [Acidobacteria bacterium RIFCSPLOWO2_12_FULL_54_10]